MLLIFCALYFGNCKARRLKTLWKCTHTLEQSDDYIFPPARQWRWLHSKNELTAIVLALSNSRRGTLRPPCLTNPHLKFERNRKLSINSNGLISIYCKHVLSVLVRKPGLIQLSKLQYDKRAEWGEKINPDYIKNSRRSKYISKNLFDWKIDFFILNFTPKWTTKLLINLIKSFHKIDWKICLGGIHFMRHFRKFIRSKLKNQINLPIIWRSFTISPQIPL